MENGQWLSRSSCLLSRICKTVEIRLNRMEERVRLFHRPLVDACAEAFRQRQFQLHGTRCHFVEVHRAGTAFLRGIDVGILHRLPSALGIFVIQFPCSGHSCSAPGSIVIRAAFTTRA